MLKRILPIVLIAMLFSFCFAEDMTIEEPKNFTVNVESADKIRDLVTDGMRDNGLNYTTDDIVTVNADGSLNVVTDGVSITVLPPFGSTAFGQDILTQFDVYSIFNDPLAFQQLLVEDGTHIYVLDLSFYTSIEVRTSKDSISSIVTDIDQLDENVLTALTFAVQEANPSCDVSVRTCGNNNFIVYDMRKSGVEVLVYSTVKNSTNIDFYLIPGGNVVTEDEIINTEYMLADVVITAA